ncbi:hypothetical protein HDV57DRAFT_495922 [Trichoderma longibrachiatum]
MLCLLTIGVLVAAPSASYEAQGSAPYRQSGHMRDDICGLANGYQVGGDTIVSSVSLGDSGERPEDFEACPPSRTRKPATLLSASLNA